jgi:predicted O-linked N-acetylglucosamine transferase (SPINDLY family)
MNGPKHDPPAVRDVFNAALAQHRAGRLAEAEALYRELLAQQPHHAGAMRHLGLIAAAAGKNDVALQLLGQALAIEPSDAAAHNDRGNILAKCGRLDEAISAYRRAIAIKPQVCAGYLSLSEIFHNRGNVDDAIAVYRQALAAGVQASAVHNNLGNELLGKGLLDEAIGQFRRAIALDPQSAQAHYNLGNVWASKGDAQRAIASYGEAISLKPDLPEAHNALGKSLAARGQFSAAITACMEALRLNPGYAGAHFNIGSAFKAQGKLAGAVAAFGNAIKIDPNFDEAHYQLGISFLDLGQFDDAIGAFQSVIRLKPSSAHAHSNLGTALKGKGEIAAAISAYQQAVSLDPTNAKIDDNLVYARLFDSTADERAIAREHDRWNRQHAQPLARFIQPHQNDRDPDRRLSIGYVSANFQDHVVGRNLLPLLSHHDREQVEIFLYSDVSKPDWMTAQFRELAGTWRSTFGISDEQLAEQIRQDRIDILVDLTLHMAGNRLLVFARKPAPVQVTFAGYPGTTGMDAIDYRLSDPYLDPPGSDESIYSEKTIRLPGTFWCFDPLECGDIQVKSSPAAQTGIVTFGCLNNFCKINDMVLSLWASVLQRVSSSRLVLMAPPGNHRDRALEVLSRQEIHRDRIEFASYVPRRKYLETYHRIDIGLDSFPYNGHTTSLDSLWMGVPVITLVGRGVVSRAGWSQLSNLKLQSLAARSPQEFTEIAAELATNLPRLAALRSTLRQRMASSPLMDAKNFARGIEDSYRQMWRSWCEAAK